MAIGVPSPLGVTLVAGGVNVAVFSKHATAIYFCLFEGDKETRFTLSSREGDVFFGFVPGIVAGQTYGLRADGPYDPSQAQFFDIAKLLIDPYAKRIDRAFKWHPDLALKGTESAHLVPKCIVAAPEPKVKPLSPSAPHFIYEVAVKAFSKLNPAIPESLRGTVAALAHPASIAHFKRVGADTIELMPLMAWADERHLANQGLSNAWGYNPISFFAPDPRLAPGGLQEIRETITTLHDAGFRVILDVVYNHTGESDLGGPTISLSGLDNATYYAHVNGVPVNDTGCGNTMATNVEPVTQLILDSMRHWVNATGLDGFRYDLAPIMGRGPLGFNGKAPLLEAIQQDTLLSTLTHIAEPWDIGLGGYQLGNFPASWGEWNDRYRDDVRHFWRGDQDALPNFATRLAGSSDIFGSRKPSCSVNFVAAHDGFTLRDFVSYTHKDNYANGEGNRDGNSSEPCWVAARPELDVRAMLTTLFLSRGTIMLTAGDEFGRSQKGNNNAYAQDNETTWLDWQKADQALIDFVGGMAAFRRQNKGYFADQFLNGKVAVGGIFPDIQWLSADGANLDWGNPNIEVFGIMLSASGLKERLLIWFNRGPNEVMVNVPAPQAGLAWDNPVSKCSGRSVTAILEVTLAKRNSLRPDDQTVAELAKVVGIQNEWWEVNGTGHRVSVETKRALLAAMALPLETYAEARKALEDLAKQPVLPRFVMGLPHNTNSIPTPGAKPNSRYMLYSEDGQRWNLTGSGNSIVLPLLEVGHYELRGVAGSDEICSVAITTGKCHETMAAKKLYGLTTHLYALRHETDCGIGDFETLAQFCEVSARLGGSLAGINPLHHMFTDDRARVSPYQPSDRRFIDPIYIDVSAFSGGQDFSSLRTDAHVDYAEVWRVKDKLLRTQFEKTKTSKDFEAFVVGGGQALQDHARFESRHDAARARYAMWLQWIADGQLAQAAKRGMAAGLELGIYRDLALGCAYEGGEVWARPELYSTAVSIGAPPDPFSRDGQVWNLPPFNPLALAHAGYRPFVDIMRANMRHAGVLRIDHVLGFARQFWVPRGASGSEGAYVTMPQSHFIALTALESELAKCIVVGEDLGTVPDGLRDSLGEANILSYRVLWFEQNEAEFYSPASYPQHAAACLSSHDLAPFKGWQETASPADVAKLVRATEKAGVNTGDLLADAHALVAETPCSLMLVQADDLTGETEPLNVPGTDTERPNWRRRLSTNTGKLPGLDSTARVIAAIAKTGRGKSG
jgi:glycogen debranching enzyme